MKFFRPECSRSANNTSCCYQCPRKFGQPKKTPPQTSDPNDLMVDIARFANSIFPIWSLPGPEAKPVQFDLYDAWTVLAATFGFTFARYYIQHIFAPRLAAAVNIIDDERFKFGESTWKAILYFCFMVWEIQIAIGAPWMTDFGTLWTRYPDVPLEPSLKFLYLLQISFYLHSLFTLVSFETKRSDYWALWGHHIVTFWLIFSSYAIGWLRVGHLILFCHDTSDLFLEIAKSFVYRGNQRIANFFFTIFLLSWLLLRLMYFPYAAIRSLWVEAPLLVPLSLWFMRPPFVALLCIILILNVYWFFMIIKLAVKIALSETNERTRPSVFLQDNMIRTSAVRTLRVIAFSATPLKRLSVGGHSLTSMNSKEFQDYFCEADHYNLRSRAMMGELRSGSLRNLAWRLFLNVLPTQRGLNHQQWPEVMAVHRKEYDALMAQYHVDPRNQGKELDPALNNPLSQNSDSPWAAFWQNEELQKEIEQDILRTYPEKPFFQRNDIRQMMLRILFIHARQNPQLSYKQGMNELLAPIIYIVDREAVQPNTPDAQEGEPLTVLLSSQYIEHDASALFTHLMNLVKPWFAADANQKRREREAREQKPFSEQTFDDDTNVILREKDPDLYRKLVELKIEPQLYMLRWIRLLLGREFHLEDVLMLWDAMLSYSDNPVTADLQLIDYICVAMLIFIRKSLLSNDYNGAMRRLFKYPPVEDCLLFVEQALNLQQNNGISPFVSSHTSAAFSQDRHARRQETKKTDNKKIFKDLFRISQSPNSQSQVSVPPQQNRPRQLSTTPSLTAQEEVIKLRNIQSHMSNRLERIIYSLQHDLISDASPKTQEQTMDILMVALAEMKQVKDVLSGLLTPDQSVTDRLAQPPSPHSRLSQINEEAKTTQPAPEKEESDPLGCLKRDFQEDDTDQCFRTFFLPKFQPLMSTGHAPESLPLWTSMIRKTRVRFNPDHLIFLEQKYAESSSLNRRRCDELSRQMGLPPRSIEIWFQNRRVRRRKQAAPGEMAKDEESKQKMRVLFLIN
ncbi:TBC1 domain family member 5-like [Planoprotostelium fungivorum]|uniref:TBC1 domain family member 5-like n=1 Tax=Planoprotostelium fungivorum TaxID=1890364 RepID=A0A2P6MM65_9EUKA|nr:TBC1 domain family member 5-like [Planoprotostelium fungivorum]